MACDLLVLERTLPSGAFLLVDGAPTVDSSPATSSVPVITVGAQGDVTEIELIENRLGLPQHPWYRAVRNIHILKRAACEFGTDLPNAFAHCLLVRRSQTLAASEVRTGFCICP